MVVSRISTFLVTGIMLFSGCAPTTNFPKIDDSVAETEARRQRIEVINSTLEQIATVQSVWWPIVKHNVELCRKTRYAIGISTMQASFFPPDYRNILISSFAMDDKVTTIFAANRSPAKAAGIQKGDKIVGVNGKGIGTGKRAHRNLSRVLNGNTSVPISMEVLSSGKRKIITVTPTKICDYPIELLRDANVNAFADGSTIYITTGMLGFVEGREELALVIGHEMAHNTRNHMRSKMTNRMIGALIGALAGAAIYGPGPYGTPSAGAQQMTNLGTDAGSLAFSQEFEAEADYVGVYHAARAGFHIEEAAMMWRRMGAANPRSISLIGTTHPSTAKRYLAIEKAVEEIRHKRWNGEPLIPEEQ